MYLFPSGYVCYVVYDTLLAVNHRWYTHTDACHFWRHELCYLALQLTKHHVFSFLGGTGLYHGIDNRCPVGETNTHVGSS